jgi:stress response protein YsnF
MSAILVGIYDDPKTAAELKQRVERERRERDRLIELNDRALESDGHIGEAELHSPDDVGAYLRDCGFDEEIASFYAESVRLGHNVIVFEAERDDEHVRRVASDMRACEPREIGEKLARWRQGDRDVFAGETMTGGLGAGAGEPPPMEAEPQRTTSEERIPIVEERAKIGKAEVERGGATIRTHVEEVPIEEEMKLREERVEVERKAADRPVEAGEEAFKERTIEVSERAEEPIVSKEARVVEEVTVSKEEIERTARISDVLRRTVVDVDTHGALDDEHIRREFEASGASGNFEDYRMAARFGHAYGGHPELRTVEYEEAEPSLRERYEAKHGKGAFDRAGDAIKRWWNKARG